MRVWNSSDLDNILLNLFLFVCFVGEIHFFFLLYVIFAFLGGFFFPCKRESRSVTVNLQEFVLTHLLKFVAD